MKSHLINRFCIAPIALEQLEQRIAPAVLLSSLDGDNGFAVNGVATNDYSGISVASAGDVNGDGFADVIISAEGADPNANSSSGSTYVVFGKSGGFAADINLATLDGTNGFRLDGVAANDKAGVAISGAGDVNGDGFDDIIIGAANADPNGSASGSSYVIFGKSSGFAASMNLSSLDGVNGFRLDGVAVEDYSGRSASGAGDINGDGFDDIIIGATNADPNGSFSGSSYVIFGKSGGFAASMNLASLNGTDGFRLDGAATNDHSGSIVRGAGNINGDGFDDIIIGAAGADPNGSYSGSSYVVFGKSGGFAASMNLASLNGTDGFRLDGVMADDKSGSAVSGAGDINGDGFDDIIIGAYGADFNGNLSGSSYVVFGKSGNFAASINLSSLNGVDGFRIDGAGLNDFSGRAVSGAGDVNGDGFDDIIIGAYGASPNGTLSGSSYVVFGKSGGFAASMNLSSLDGTNGFQMDGEATNDFSGSAVSAAGDINGDGFDDILVGAFATDPNGNYSGSSYVVFGSFVDVTGTALNTAGNGKSATFTDVDGDLVTIKVSKGTIADLDLVLAQGGVGAHIFSMDTSNIPTGANITISAKATALGGDGFTNVGFLDATGVDLGSVKIDGDLGRIEVGDADLTTAGIKSLAIQSLGTFLSIGDQRDSHSAGALSKLTVKQSLQGVSFTATSIGSVVAGSMNEFNGFKTLLYSDTTIKSVKIRGDINGASDALVQIIARGNPQPATTQLAQTIGSVTVGGDASFFQILAGFNSSAVAANSEVQIGKVSINGDWSASSIAAGINSGISKKFGDNDDSVVGGGGAIVSRIASFVIKGQAIGSLDAGESFGIEAQQIGSAKIGKANIPLTAGLDQFQLGPTNNFRLRELA